MKAFGRILPPPYMFIICTLPKELVKTETPVLVTLLQIWFLNNITSYTYICSFYVQYTHVDVNISP